MNDYFMQRREAQTDTSLFEMRLRAERAERERDIARRDYDVMNKFREHAEEERDALAAHVERLRELLSWGREVVLLDSLSARNWNGSAGRALVEQPETSLARLIAEKQAEVLGECAGYGDRVGVDYWQGFLRAKAERLRLQAEEKPQET